VLSDLPWLASKPAMRVLDLLNADGEEARVVGGAVRNALMGLPVGDIDIATTALPEEVVRRAQAAHIKAVPTGIAHGTVTLVLHDEAFEVTTLREDIETFGRKAKVAFGRDWARDAQRRDFTINGLSWARDGAVHDHVGGLDDIAARRVRFIGDPDRRIAEDYLRILRFFRIQAAYGAGAPDRAAFDACIRGRAGLASLSAERVRAELLKLLIADGAVAALDAMSDCGLLVALTGGVPYLQVFANMAQVEHDLGLAPDAMRRLAALSVATTEDAARLTSRLRLSNAESRALQSMADGWWWLRGLDDGGAKRILYRLGPVRYRDRLLLTFARGDGCDAARRRELATLSDRWDAPVFPLKATDFIARGIAEGPALGHVLALAEDAWIAAEFPSGSDTIVAIADASVADFARAHRYDGNRT
jgi:tRNA nucleotidyltransferase/poly(A) polymerase